MDSTPPGLPSIEPIKDDLMQSPLTGESSEKTPASSTTDPSVTKQLPGLLDNGKLNYIESKIRPENHIDVTERVLYFRNFRSVMEKDISSMHQTIEIPVEYQTMIASLVQESDETLSVLSQRINDILSPWERKDQASDYFIELIERVIKVVSHREKYGVHHKAIAPIEGAPLTVPAHLSLMRWEAKDLSAFPDELYQTFDTRRKARQTMSEDATALFLELTPEQQLSYLNPKSRRANGKEKMDPQTTEELKKIGDENEQEKEEKRKKKEEEKKKRDEEKKKRDEEKRLREEERKKKEQSQLRLTSLFTKPKEEKSSLTWPFDLASEASKAALFPPFFVKEFTVMTVANPVKDSSEEFESTIKSYKSTPSSKPCQVSTESRERFLNEIKTLNPGATNKRGVQRKIDLRAVWLGPGLSGANADFLNNQSLNSLVRMKLLHFAEDVRPAYYGTWTKVSKCISGRTPFAVDEDLIDYDHDSEAEWEPEGEGEDIQSGDDEEEELGMDMVDPEDASWLVPEGYLSDNEGVESEEEDIEADHSQESKRTRARQSLRPLTRKSMSIRQIIIGPTFENSEETAVDDCLKLYETKMLIDCKDSYDPFLPGDESNTLQTKAPGLFTKEHTDVLMNIIDGKADNMSNILLEAKSNWLLRDVSKRQIEAKIKDIAVKEKRGTDTKPAWYMKE